MPNNAPPLAGAICWARELLRRVEGPMETFRSNPSIMQSVVRVEALSMCSGINCFLASFEISLTKLGSKFKLVCSS